MSDIHYDGLWPSPASSSVRPSGGGEGQQKQEDGERIRARAEGATGRVGVPSVVVCPRCDGQLYDRGSCQMCANAGYLAESGERLEYVQLMQLAATFTLSVGLDLCLPSTEAVEARTARFSIPRLGISETDESHAARLASTTQPEVAPESPPADHRAVVREEAGGLGKAIRQAYEDGVNAIVEDIGRGLPDWDPADLHEDVRETLWPHIEPLITWANALTSTTSAERSPESSHSLASATTKAGQEEEWPCGCVKGETAHGAGWADCQFQRVTHGRHCQCMGCEKEDWTRPDLGPCGMHGPECPAVYAPLGGDPWSPSAEAGEWVISAFRQWCASAGYSAEIDDCPHVEAFFAGFRAGSASITRDSGALPKSEDS